MEGTRGIDFLFGIIIAVVCANWIAQFVHKDGVYESELDHDGNVFFLRTEAPNALQYKVAADVSFPSCFWSLKSGPKGVVQLVREGGRGDAANVFCLEAEGGGGWSR